MQQHRVLGELAQERLESSESGDDFSLSSLHKRTPPEGIHRIQKYIELFQNGQRRRLIDGLGRSTRYMEGFRKIFRDKSLPVELTYLPLIESGYVATAVSPAQAAGIWQFIEDTGRRYNLERTPWSDQRMDPMASARAAASLLGHLYKRFGNWEHALAAYNSGARTVEWAIKVNKKAGKPTHFWALDLPEETQNYVPNFLAVVLIAKNPDAFGFTEIQYQPRLAYDLIKVSPGTYLHELATRLDISQNKLWELNPTLVLGQVPPGETPQSIRIPDGLRDLIPAKVAEYKGRLKDWVLHRVSRDDTVDTLASRFRSKSERILQLNRLDGDEDLIQREFVIIPL
ncbi:MAG: transglycosylase SLT domain-containing protein [Deltaproteobacteria bacterium]|nr:transglycosylase SLT domain-containing protein [Deltaproteobacteria bacterium]